MFAINTGLRKNEFFNLAWEDIDIEQKRLKMVVKKNQKALSLPLNETALGIVEGRPKHGRHVFHNPMRGDRFKLMKGALVAAVKRARLPKVTWHMFRHTFAARLWGEPLR